MAWDAAKGTGKRPIDWLNPFLALNTPWRAIQAARLGGGAAGLLGALNVVSAIRIFAARLHLHTLIGSNPVVLTGANFAAAVIATALMVIMGNRQPVWASGVVVVWASCEMFPWITYSAYGHLTFRGGLPAMVLLTAILGLRGALANRKLAKTQLVNTDPPS